ncbi:MAG: hypothetical protein LBQ30_05845 [Treponema sp.]|jgi:16S rRNA (cytosine1407-C5)-methyltransferase|nr:hypothetical protein [Treponema sp.]
MGCNELFEAYYRALYHSRWDPLGESLLETPVTIPFSTGLTAPYMLDQGSVRAAESLRLPDEGIILDTCAASGGKSLANKSSRER